MIDKANDIEDLIWQIADLLSIGNRVKYDLKNLYYGGLIETILDEYSDYFEMEELPEDIDQELLDWELE